jgi:MoaA/NifB/PqqE/SkfB family radical SAM enzyme
MHISLNPTYYCNFRCPFCYLGDMLLDKTTLSVDHVYEKLTEVLSHGYNIDSIDLYGGEILSLPKEYQSKIIEACLSFCSEVRVTTNLSLDYTELLKYPVQVCVSYDYTCREDHVQVLANMINFPADLHVLMLASKGLVKKNVENIIAVLNTVPNLKTVEIKPYSTNQYNQFDVKHSEFEEFVKKFILNKDKLEAHFVNEDMIQASLAGQMNSFSDDHVYITPNNKFAVLDFDDQDNEKFTELDNFQEYINWTQKEKFKVSANSYCNQCEYFGKCLSEHLRDVQSLEHSCNGYKLLLDWYKERA